MITYLPRCGYFQIVGGAEIEHRYWTDFGDVLLSKEPEADDAVFRKEILAFARERWVAGENPPFKWPGPTDVTGQK